MIEYVTFIATGYAHPVHSSAHNTIDNTDPLSIQLLVASVALLHMVTHGVCE